MSYAQQAINSLDQTINSFKSRVDVKVSDVSTSTANIQATTNRIYENIERFKNDLMHGEESQIAHENILRIDQIIKEQFSILQSAELLWALSVILILTLFGTAPFRNCQKSYGSPVPDTGSPMPLSQLLHG